MAYEENLRSFSADADTTIGIYTGVPGLPGSASPNGGKQYCALALTGTHQVGLCTVPGLFVGVLQNKPQKAGAPSTVGYQGISFALAGGVIAAGDELTVDATTSRFLTVATPASPGTELLAPTGAAATASTTGGTIAAGTYYYVVTATNASGESTRSNEVSVTLTGTTSSVSVAFTASTGATGYKLYRGTSTGNETLVQATGTVSPLVDTGAAGTPGTPPATNTTAATSTVAVGRAMAPTAGAGELFPMLILVP